MTSLRLLHGLLLFLLSSTVALPVTTTIALYDLEGNVGLVDSPVAGIGSNPVSLNVIGDPQYDIDHAPSPVPGAASVFFDGSGDYLQSFAGDVPTAAVNNIGMEAWVKADAFGGFNFVANLGYGGGQPRGFGIIQQNSQWRLLYNGVGYPAISTTPTVTGQWVHLAAVIDGGTARLFVNGVEESSGAGLPGAIDPALDHMTIGGNPWDVPNGVWNGLIDYVRVFTFNPGEFSVSDLSYEKLEASDPIPANSSTNIDVVDIELSWAAGDTAVFHDVYFGTDQAVVMNATTATAGIFQGNQAGAVFDPGVLDFDTTYYWRIDEVESTNPMVVHTGDVWSFTTRSKLNIADLFPDFDGNCKIDIGDLQFLAQDWLETDSLANVIGSLDLGLDRVALDDYAVLTSHWGQECITLDSLLDEMIDRDRLARFPEIEYESLQASSYDRSSVVPDQPGWFSNGDCCGYIRTEQIGGQTEYVIMEHDGPGCITRMWTPFFYHSLSNHGGPNIRFYLDGASTPVIDENFIELLTGGNYPGAPAKSNSFEVPTPFSTYTARAGDLFLPIPFAQGCKITTTSSPFYNIINYRGYASGTPVKSFNMDDYNAALNKMSTVGAELNNAPDYSGGTELTLNQSIPSGGEAMLSLPAGSAAVRHLQITLSPDDVSATLRSTVLQMTFDGEQTVWCPVGDFFCSPDSIHSFQTFERTVTSDGRMTCRWVMPYETNAEIKLLNLGSDAVTADMVVRVGSWTWDERSMHFRTNWRRDHAANPGNNVFDWNFIDASGQGVHVGDSFTVVYPRTLWWGEGDEKVWVDDDFTENFPSHHGTGTEDYYGWAGGEPPHGDTDDYSHPFTANRVGSLTTPEGYNICTRTRALDATPFKNRFKFDMEAWSLSGGATQLVAYESGVTHWYAIPGTTDNRPPSRAHAAEPIYTVEILKSLEAELNGTPYLITDAIEFENHPVYDKTTGLSTASETIPVVSSPSQWSNQRQFLIQASQDGDYVEFEFASSTPESIKVYMAKMSNYGIVRISVNGAVVGDYDTYAELPNIMAPIDLGTHSPTGGSFIIRFEIVGKNAASSGRSLGLDCIVF